jgi:hypothetical protein
MADLLTGGTFGGFADVTSVLGDTVRAAVLAEIDKLVALLPTGAVVAIGSSGERESLTDFDQIMPHTAAKIQAEIAALRAAVDAAPTA